MFDILLLVVDMEYKYTRRCEEDTGEIEENIKKIKNFIGFESDDLTGEK